MHVKRIKRTSSFNNGIFLTSDGGVRNEYANYLRTIPILRQQNNWAGGWVRKIDIRFLLMFSTAQRKLERLQFSTSSSFVKI